MKSSSLITFLMAFVSFWLTFSAEEFQRVEIKSMRCNNVSEKYIFRNYSCYAKSYSRHVSTGNVRMEMKKPLNNFYLIFQLFFKYGTIYREVLHLNNVNWCEITNKGVSTALIKFILDLAIDSAPQVIHECPYENVIMINATFKTAKATSIFPRGDYKMNLIFVDEFNETIVDFASAASVISSYIETFG